METTKENALQVLQLGALDTNCYILKGNVPGAAVVVDPADEAERIEQALEGIGAKQVDVLLTHGHYDHMGAADSLRSKLGARVYILAEDEQLLSDPRLNCSFSFSGGAVTAVADQLLKDGDELLLAGHQIQVIATPGHTAGGACYYLPQLGLLFSGDTLFAGSVGRSDLPTGNMMQLMRSVRSKLGEVSDETYVLPGHGPVSTMERERRENPFLQD